jgi:hypothetical protein
MQSRGDTAEVLRITRGYDVKTVKRNRAFDEALHRNEYEVELARGTSHIASMLYEQSILAAVRETILEFEASHGRSDLKAFVHALLRRLELRGKPAAAKLLGDFIECGSLPAGVSRVPFAPSARKSVRKPESTDLRKARAGEAAKAA